MSLEVILPIEMGEGKVLIKRVKEDIIGVPSGVWCLHTVANLVSKNRV